MALAVISSILNVGILLSLAFAMGVAALASLIIVKVINAENIAIDVRPNKVRVFKRDHFSVDSVMTVMKPRWVSARFSSLQSPLGVEARAEILAEDSIEISIEPFFAGRHRGIGITIEVSDPLDLFKKQIRKEYPEFTIDVLPISLLAFIPKAKPSSLSSGEAPARFLGTSVELYSLEEYRPYGETRNILWKKVARMPDERLIVRTRESNNPQFVRIGIILDAKRDNVDERIRLMDKVCESIGFLGNNLIAMGCSVEIVKASRGDSGGVETTQAENIDELGETLMEVWEGEPRNEKLGESELLSIIFQSDIVVTGFLETQERNFALLLSKKRSLLVRDGDFHPAFVNERTTIYTDYESLRRLALKVVEK